jgi:pimeloyl-ACP methyl ester carboxylesterase
MRAPLPRNRFERPCVDPDCPHQDHLAAPARSHTRSPRTAKVEADVPTRVLICRDDRLFPTGFLRRVARERLGIAPDEIDGGHTPALGRPHELADRLEAYAAEQGLLGNH